MKRYSLCYTSDKIVCHSNDHFYGYASTIKTAKGYISEVKKYYADDNPRDFRVYDHWADVDPETNYVPCVYRRES